MNKAQIPPLDIPHRLRLLDVLDRITQVCLASKNMEDSLSGVLDLVLEVFNADRAWFLYPCDPDALFWNVPMERTRPEWPGLFAQGVDMPMDSGTSEIFSELLGTNGTIQYSPDIGHPVLPHIAEDFAVKSQLMIALRPKIGNAWVFGLHHCASVVNHDEEDLHLFTAIAHRISDTLSVLISIRQLRKSEKRSQGMADSVIDNAGVLVVVQDKDGRIVRFNRASEKLSGYTFAEVEGKHTWDLVLPPEDADNIRQDAFEALAHNPKTMAGHYTNYWLNKSGERFQIEWANTLLLDAVGNMEFMVSVGTDITERKLVEEALTSSEQKFKKAFYVNPDSININRLEDGRYVSINSGFTQIMGYTEDDILGHTSIEFNIWDNPEDRARLVQGLKKDAAVSNLEARFRTKDGSIRYGLMSAAVIEIEGVPHVLSITRDITEKKLAESEIRIAAAAFESQESIMITDADRVILRVNKAFTKDTGYTAEEAVGQTPRLLKSGRHNADFYHAIWETIHRTGAWQGEIWDRRKNGDIYPKWLTISAVKGDDGVVTHYVGTHIDITERKAAEEKIQYLGFYDALTRLPNRRLLADRLHHALASSARSGREGALLFIDLDNFKTINDILGHGIGDLLLQQVAQRLDSCVREGDTVARLGGDEFVVILEDLSEQPIEAAAQTEAVGEKILTAISQPYLLASYEYHSTTSIGATLFNDNQQATDELMKQADIAMYQAKKAGRNALRFFDPQMQASITARVSLEDELHKALEKQQFHLYYQIQVDSSRRPLGAEALIRWIHPERGLVSPAQFIPLAEETGLILPIGQWVMETACAQITAWQQEAHTRDLVLAVNVSAKQFRQADFVAQVQAVVQRHGINPMLLKLELTESLLQENIEETIATMNTLNEIGVQFSLDDFGTGYSSLQYLKRLPLDQIKIDQSFVRDIADDSSDEMIVRTIIAMAHSLDLDVIAEGVETEEQRQLLLTNGCAHYQGYLFGRPLPIEQFEAFLKQD